MKDEFHGVTHITPADGNIFADLGFSPDDAAKLLAETDRAILERIAIKESLMTEISSWISSQNLKQIEASKILGVTRPRVSDVVNKKMGNFTIDSLVNMLSKTGKRIQLSISN